MKSILKSFFTEHWKYMAVVTACKLSLFDNLQVPKTAEVIAKDLSLNSGKVLLLLNALHNAGFLDRINNSYKNNELSKYLTDSNTESLKYACLNWGAEHLNAWQYLEHSIETGKSSFEKVYGLSYFEYLDDNPEKLIAYHKAMYQYAKDDYKTLPQIIDFSQYNTVMDVGGGYGAALESIKKNNPHIKCFLFDLNKVLANVNNPKIINISGSFFDKIPPLAEVIILSRIIHDWNDDKARIILRNCFDALPSEGMLYIIENCTDRVDTDLSLLSLNMTAICESYERSSEDYLLLTKESSFALQNIYKLNELQTILAFIKK